MIGAKLQNATCIYMEMIHACSSSIRMSLKLKKQLPKDFSNICDWFVVNELCIHFGEDKTKPILLSSERNLKLVEKLDITCKDIKIKQYKHVNYLVCMLDESMLGETMALRVIGKINSGLKFVYQKNQFLDVPLRRLLCNALIEPHFVMVPKFVKETKR